MTMTCDAGNFDACICEQDLGVIKNHRNQPVEAPMPDLAAIRANSPSHLVSGILAIGAMLIVVVYVGLPFGLAIDAKFKSLPIALVIGLGVLVLSAAVVLSILRSTAKIKARPKHQKAVASPAYREPEAAATR